MSVSQESLSDIYDTDAYFSGEKPDSLDYMRNPHVMHCDRLRFRDELRRLRRWTRGRRVLDVGCATGHFLKIARDEGWCATGIEVSRPAARFAAETYGVDVFVGELKDAPFEEACFDVITLHHVLEHVPDPVGLLAQDVRPLLAEDGLLVVEVPNLGSIQARVNGRDWEDLLPSQHLYHFTARTLAALLESSGFRAEKITTLSQPATRILGPFVYVGIPDKWTSFARRRVHGDCWRARPQPTGGAVGSVLRRTAYIVSRPASYVYGLLKMECRLVVYARKDGLGDTCPPIVRQ